MIASRRHPRLSTTHLAARFRAAMRPYALWAPKSSKALSKVSCSASLPTPAAWTSLPIRMPSSGGVYLNNPYSAVKPTSSAWASKRIANLRSPPDRSIARPTHFIASARSNEGRRSIPLPVARVSLNQRCTSPASSGTKGLRLTVKGSGRGRRSELRSPRRRLPALSLRPPCFDRHPLLPLPYGSRQAG